MKRQIRTYFTSFERALFVGGIFSILFSIVYFQTTCDKISKKVFRLHIIANSDSPEDQNLKLKIRDRILERFDNEKLCNLDDAKNFARENSEVLKNVARDEIIRNGFDYNVQIHICESEFNTRKYDKITLPAGEYASLKIIVGSGGGKNWWCVLFPPICLGASEEHEENLSIFSQNEKNIIENEDKYEVQFKIVEIIRFVRMFFRKIINNLILFMKENVHK